APAREALGRGGVGAPERGGDEAPAAVAVDVADGPAGVAADEREGLGLGLLDGVGRVGGGQQRLEELEPLLLDEEVVEVVLGEALGLTPPLPLTRCVPLGAVELRLRVGGPG